MKIKQYQKLNSQFIKYFCVLFFCITALIVFIPLNPAFPGNDLDASWQFAINQALAQGLVFGKDIIFTFGPYGSIYTKVYHPSVDHLMIWSSTFLGVCYTLLLLLLTKNKNPYWLLMYGIFLVLFIISRDTLLFSYPFFLALLIYRLTLPEIHSNKLKLSQPYTLLILGILFSPLGLLFLVKGSFFLICIAISILCAVFLFYCKRRTAAILALIVPLFSMVAFWHFARQPIIELPTFFIHLNEIISGYNEAMAFNPEINIHKSIKILLYIFSAALTFYVVLSNSLETKITRSFLWLSYALFLFIAFKGGFVRYDSGHYIMASSALFIIAFSLWLLFKQKSNTHRKSIFICTMLIFFSGISIEINSIIKYSLPNIKNFYATAYEGIRIRLINPYMLKENFDYAIANIQKEISIPELTGTTDIYSYNQSLLFASNNTWNPRPIFQSYSAYTPLLAMVNLQHLRHTNAPDNIIFRVESIDNRLSALEDGLSWPTLINNYLAVDFKNDLLYLKKKTVIPTNNPIAKSDFYHHEYPFNEEVILPATKEPLFAQILIKPTLLGKIITVLFKPSELNISIKLDNGEIKNYRVISSMLASGFIITPLIENTQDFTFLANHKNNMFTGHIVKSFHLSTNRFFSLFWCDSYFIRLYKLLD